MLSDEISSQIKFPKYIVGFAAEPYKANVASPYDLYLSHIDRKVYSDASNIHIEEAADCSVPYVSVFCRDAGAFFISEEKYIGAPYLTEYGEEDNGLELGK